MPSRITERERRRSIRPRIGINFDKRNENFDSPRSLLFHSPSFFLTSIVFPTNRFVVLVERSLKEKNKVRPHAYDFLSSSLLRANVGSAASRFVAYIRRTFARRPTTVIWTYTYTRLHATRAYTWYTRVMYLHVQYYMLPYLKTCASVSYPLIESSY